MIFMSAASTNSSPAYETGPKAGPVVQPYKSLFAAAHLDHGHMYNQTPGLREVGATLMTQAHAFKAAVLSILVQLAVEKSAPLQTVRP